MRINIPTIGRPRILSFIVRRLKIISLCNTQKLAHLHHDNAQHNPHSCSGIICVRITEVFLKLSIVLCPFSPEKAKVRKKLIETVVNGRAGQGPSISRLQVLTCNRSSSFEILDRVPWIVVSLVRQKLTGRLTPHPVQPCTK